MFKRVERYTRTYSNRSTKTFALKTIIFFFARLTVYLQYLFDTSKFFNLLKTKSMQLN